MPDAHFRDAWCRRLGLPLLGGKCHYGLGSQCGHPLLPDDHHHTFLCPRTGSTRTHDAVKRCLLESLQWLKLRVLDLDSVEGINYFETVVQGSLGERPLPHRPDLLVHASPGAPTPVLGGLLLDVHVPHWWASTPAVQRTTLTAPEARAEAAWQAKLAKDYRGWKGPREQYELHPAVFPTGGLAHPELDRWLHRVLKWSAARNTLPGRERQAVAAALTYRTYGSLSVCLQVAVAERRRSALNMPPLCGPRTAAGRPKRWDAVIAHQGSLALGGDPESEEQASSDA